MVGDINKECFHRVAAGYLMNHAPVILLVLDMMGNILQCSAFSKQLTGKELVGKNISDIIVDFHHSFSMERLLEKDPGKEHLVNIETGGGLPQTCYFKFFGDDGIVFAFGRLEVSETERLRKELLSLTNDLNASTRGLQKKNAGLMHLNRLKNQFLGMAAHDLRKPLSVIMLSSDFVLSETPPVPEQRYRKVLDNILSASGSMKRLIDDFLDVAAIESGKFPLHIEPSNLKDIIQGSLEMNIHAAGKKDVPLDFQWDDRIPVLRIDGLKIEQVVANLVENAIRYSPTGSGVEIVARWLEDTKEAMVTVTDHGGGIEKEQLDVLFLPFEKRRPRTGHTPGSKNAGLGLAISRKILEAHGGKIWCDSRVGEGAAFSFSLPSAPQETGNDD